MESDDSDSDTDSCDKHIFLRERVDAKSLEKQELYIQITYKSHPIGYLNAVIMDMESLKRGGFKDNKLHCQDKEIEDELLLFYKSLNQVIDTAVVFYITDFFLESSYRGLGLGGDILQQLPNWLKIHHPEVNDLYLFPYPLEKVNGKVECVQSNNPKKIMEMRKKLIRFYLAHGLRKTQTEFLYMPIHPAA